MAELNVQHVDKIYDNNVQAVFDFNLDVKDGELIVLLAAFLCSEGIKNYKISYAYVMIVLGIIQLVRIFIYPVTAHNSTVIIQEQAVTVMETPQFIRCALYLVLSAASLFVGAFVGMTRSKQLSAHLKTLGLTA